MTIEEAYKIPCPFCGRADIGVKERIIELFEKSALKKCWAYCRYCEAEGRKTTIEAEDSENGRDVEAAALEAWTIRKALPPVTPQPKMGRWIYDKNIENWRCSKCGETPKTRGYCGAADFMAEHFKYCNHCGAKMTEVEDEESN